MRNNRYYVRWQRLSAIVPITTLTDWYGPIKALGPYAAAKQVLLAEDWTDLPISLRVEVYDECGDYEYDVVVDTISKTVVTRFMVVLNALFTGPVVRDVF